MLSFYVRKDTSVLVMCFLKWCFTWAEDVSKLCRIWSRHGVCPYIFWITLAFVKYSDRIVLCSFFLFCHTHRTFQLYRTCFRTTHFCICETCWGWKCGLTPLLSLRSNAHWVIREILPYIRAQFAFKLGHENFPNILWYMADGRHPKAQHDCP